MNKYVLMGLLGLMAFATPAAHAQLFGSRPRGPGIDPRYGYQYGYPQRGLFGGGPFGPTIFPPQQQVLPGQVDPFGPNTGVSAGRQAGQGLADPGSPLVTGHPTRFAAYGGYFSNQGGSSAPSATAPSRIPPSATAAVAVGAQPNATQPSRSKTSTTGTSRQPRR